ncbi:EcsC family protein [Microbacterium sp. bgisy203]|uniref:EcsC family protein n=1 Tax=Microbacterium sp. bgisy203 TaxID=3413799 RepID=UPI003D754B98
MGWGGARFRKDNGRACFARGPVGKASGRSPQAQGARGRGSGGCTTSGSEAGRQGRPPRYGPLLSRYRGALRRGHRTRNLGWSAGHRGASAGAGAAPSAGAVVGAVAADAAAVLTLATRAVGHVALLYGYDPEDPNEKIFALSVVNTGTAVSATAKTAALADVSRLTQALVRGKTWDALNKSVISKVSGQFAKAFGVRLTKKSLGKFVPVVGILLGGTFNWATLEGIFDAADVAYRRRFLAEKYPQLIAEAPIDMRVVEDEEHDVDDERISVLEELADAGGPDLLGREGPRA